MSARPSTLAEKIIARACGRERVTPGETVVVKVDLAMANDLTGPLAIEQFRAAGARRVFDPDRVCFVAGRHMPFKNAAFAATVDGIGDFCREQGIAQFFANTEGMDHGLVPELGFIRPGMLVCNADSHTCTYGALGALGVPMGSTDMAYTLAFGETWLRVPETIRVVYRGRPGRFVTSKDYVLSTVGRLGVDGAMYKAVEFTGEALDALTVDERFTIANMAIEMGAKTGLMAPDEKVRDYLADRTSEPYETDLSIDPDSPAVRTVEIDVAGFGPVVARPPSPGDVVPVSDIRGVRITQVNIGSCNNGRMIDLERALQILAGRKVAPHVRLFVTPATEIVWREAERRGYIDAFRAAGAIVNPPGCGNCCGWHQGLLGDDDVCVATHNRNFRGRMGSVKAETYLASPYVAAASAVAGEIASPEAIVAS